MMYTYAIQRKTTGEFLVGCPGRKPIETSDLAKAIHRKTARMAQECAELELGGNAKRYQIVKVAHALQVCPE